MVKNNMRDIDIPAEFVHVAVFGDSFAARSYKAGPGEDPWFEILKNRYGFNVTSYGKNGASNEYIFNQFHDNHPRYDYIIYITTASGRFSLPSHIHIPDENEYLRHNMPNIMEHHIRNSRSFSDKSLTKSLEVLGDYYAYLFDEQTASHISKALTLYAKSIRPERSLFLDIIQEDGVGLMDISKKELDYAGIDLEDMRKYSDTRNCHISQRNNEILADKIANWINTSEFELNPDHFEYDANLDRAKLFNLYDEF